MAVLEDISFSWGFSPERRAQFYMTFVVIFAKYFGKRGIFGYGKIVFG
jgi:hypothetical protein